MRIPNLTDLDRDQERVYLEAPMDDVILVTGPPGSGKTIMAWHRAEALLETGIQVQLTMYTKALRRYVETGKESESLRVEHFDQWTDQWWRKARIGRLPKQEVGGFRPIDWKKVQKLVVATVATDLSKLKELNWGHLVIDEGQDFGENMYLALVCIQDVLKNQGVKTGFTVFADDNQKIHNEDQSTTYEIANRIVPGEWTKPPTERDRLFRLRKNYRNTLQIHKFAWYFAVFKEEDDQEPEKPDRRGNPPQVHLLKSDKEIIQLIKRVCEANPSREIGVVIPSYKSRRRVIKMYNKLKYNLKNTAYKAQAYIHQNERKNFREEFSDKNLEFDSPNRLTVVTDKSVKGLEFDIVFLLDLESLRISDDGAEETAKNLFVTSSRARNELYLCCIADEETPPDILGFLPPANSELCVYEPEADYEKIASRMTRVDVPKKKLRGH